MDYEIQKYKLVQVCRHKKAYFRCIFVQKFELCLFHNSMYSHNLQQTICLSLEIVKFGNENKHRVREVLIRVLKETNFLTLRHQLKPRPYLIFGSSLMAFFSQRIPPVLIFKLQLTGDKLILSYNEDDPRVQPVLEEPTPNYVLFSPGSPLYQALRMPQRTRGFMINLSLGRRRSAVRNL